MNELQDEAIGDVEAIGGDEVTGGGIIGDYGDVGDGEAFGNNEVVGDEAAGDEAVGDLSRSPSIDSMESGITKSRTQYGRTYHSYPYAIYLLPNDQIERSRQYFENEAWKLTLNQRLYLAPIKELIVRQGAYVLDLGTGTGTWAINFADEYPQAIVIGNDLTPIQPIMVPPNARFEIDNIEYEWNFAYKFTYIHARGVVPHLRNPSRIIEQAFDALRPGGYFEIQDQLFWFESDDEISLGGTAIREWAKMLQESAWNAELDWNCPNKYKQYMQRAGFSDVTEVEYRWPINPTNEEIGDFCKSNLLALLDSTEALTRYHSMSPKEVNKLQDRVREEIESIRAYMPIKIVYGRKE